MLKEFISNGENTVDIRTVLIFLQEILKGASSEFIRPH
uniref:Uncharacterized protein n=1 Tax=Anguilla anguilla TaxID=7936 RepID=A0A0E9UVZ6_ANGAN